MALPLSDRDRTLRHTRSISIEVFRRQDGNWEIDASLQDVKTHDVLAPNGVHVAGRPIHRMTVRLVMDGEFNILAAGAVSDRVPYPGSCESAADVYELLTGLNVFRQFRRGLAERTGGINGCTHLNELAAILPTAVIQGMAEESFSFQTADVRPFPIDQCHSLRADGDIVKTYFPKWHVASSVK
ncbi:DUF2889 domain-containing protein [Cupriavidus necator]|uniref:DUF2889 domain-containing protein n=1 Tax=Cupriavidus necator TaxID=106590 RepID=UPI003F73748D